MSRTSREEREKKKIINIMVYHVFSFNRENSTKNYSQMRTPEHKK
jgi:hypothetical protein